MTPTPKELGASQPTITIVPLGRQFSVNSITNCTRRSMMLLNHHAPLLLVCRRCKGVSRQTNLQGLQCQLSQLNARHFASDGQGKVSGDQNDSSSSSQSEPGAMSRRLQEATEEALLTGGRSGRKAVEDAGFSEELKEKLLDKIAGANFKAENAAAFAEVNMPSGAGDGTRQMAAAEPWTGEETTPDVVLRMLDDARKPLKPELRARFQTPVVDTRIKRASAVKPAQKLASARERASLYAGMGMKEKGSGHSGNGLSEKEREEMRREFQARFEPAARAVPATLSGLAALANERIENAMARGQFQNLPRGKPMEADPYASNPFVDTTEYLMNRIIQRQEIVPPWIEKQQELVKAVNSFRLRLRSDWRRHAARMIAAKGGSLAEQIGRAEGHAEAERRTNPREADAAPSTASTAGGAAAAPFRDPDWERAERSYLTRSVENLNSMTRSYNLMAPELARKPYYTLERELSACFADVAPQVAGEIRGRATRPASSSLSSSKPSPFKGAGLGFGGGGDAVRVYESTRSKPYGMKEWWRDVWKKE